MDSVTDGATSTAGAGTASAVAARRSVPLRRRKADWVLLAFFAVNLFFITYFVDIEQLTIANPHHFAYPAWPPRAIVDLVHSYGSKYDPLLMARPAFWRMTIWIDVLWNGPFYVAAIYAISRGREWIRLPALVWSGSMSAVVLIILAEEYNGIHATPHFSIVLLLNIPWLALPIGTIIRMSRQHPFTEPAAALTPHVAAPLSAPVLAVTMWRRAMKSLTGKSNSDGAQPETASYAYQEAERVFHWYVKNAKNSRLRFQVSELVLLAAAAAVPVAGVLSPGDARPAAIVGAVVVMLTGFRSVFHWHDNWARFSGACAEIKAELRLYHAGAEPYEDLDTRDELLLRKINSAEMTETAKWMTLPAPGNATAAGSPE